MNLVGLETDTTKIKKVSKHMTFCNLCQRKIMEGEVGYSWPGSKFLVHLNCSDPRIQMRMHLVEFRKIAKKKKPRKNPKGKKTDKLVPAQNPERGVARSHGRGWRDVR